MLMTDLKTSQLNIQNTVKIISSFRFEHVKDGWGLIRVKHSGKVLDVDGGSQNKLNSSESIYSTR